MMEGILVPRINSVSLWLVDDMSRNVINSTKIRKPVDVNKSSIATLYEALATILEADPAKATSGYL
ncbi:MAG: hypothetical protein RQ885_14265 [Desulfurococcales archaeon]|jgi:hypothetical protein|nr:hypothetical protein [Desulfurococcales archaeon]